MTDISLLKTCISEADSLGFVSRNLLWEEAARRCTRLGCPVSPSTARRCGGTMDIRTPIGSRGGKKSVPRRPGGTQVVSFDEVVEGMRKAVPKEFARLVEKAARGSRAAGIRLKCLECCGWSRSEVRKCEAVECPLWRFLARKS